MGWIESLKNAAFNASVEFFKWMVEKSEAFGDWFWNAIRNSIPGSYYASWGQTLKPWYDVVNARFPLDTVFLSLSAFCAFVAAFIVVKLIFKAIPMVG